ncbi:unnamed protein product [Urochloa humidicola]
MRRDGRRHGWVYAVDRSLVDPEGKRRACTPWRALPPPTAGSSGRHASLPTTPSPPAAAARAAGGSAAIRAVRPRRRRAGYGTSSSTTRSRCSTTREPTAPPLPMRLTWTHVHAPYDMDGSMHEAQLHCSRETSLSEN